MKQGGLICICLLLVFMFCVPVFAQPNSKSVETILIDNFDNPDEMDWTWNVQASKFVHVGKDANGNAIADDTYPKWGYVEGMPNSLRGFRGSTETNPLVLGVEVAFNRKGDNWFEVYPVSKETGELYEIPLIGHVSQVDFWIWGSNYNYFIELLVRDSDSRVHVIPATSTLFEGWKNIIVRIPTSIRQNSRLRSGPDNLTLVGFRVRSDANEYVDNFLIYFDQLRYSTYTMNYIYDGYELRNSTLGSQGETGK